MEEIKLTTIKLTTYFPVGFDMFVAVLIRRFLSGREELDMPISLVCTPALMSNYC